MRRRVMDVIILLLSTLVPLAVAAAIAIPRAVDEIYPAPLSTSGVSRSSVILDPDKPTVAIVVGRAGASVADTLGPYEVFARTGAYNVVIVAADPDPVPLTGGLDVVPDLTFSELEEQDPSPPDVVVVPQINGDASEVVSWVQHMKEAGAPLIMSVCVGAETLAKTGMIDDRPATSHWLKLIGLRLSDPQVKWTGAKRFVDDGDIITTASVWSGIDGAIRVVERTLGAETATRIADDLHWRGYRPGGSVDVPETGLAVGDVVGVLNAGFRWDRATTGALLTDGVGEVELAATFRSYTELSYLTRLESVSVGGGAVTSKHGLTFLPHGDLETAGGFDRLLIPGRDVTDQVVGGAIYLHHGAGSSFAVEPVLRDVGEHFDVASAAWGAKSQEYPMTFGMHHAALWPWLPTGRAVLLIVAGGALGLTMVAWRNSRRRATENGQDPNAETSTARTSRQAERGSDNSDRRESPWPSTSACEDHADDPEPPKHVSRVTVGSPPHLIGAALTAGAVMALQAPLTEDQAVACSA